MTGWQWQKTPCVFKKRARVTGVKEVLENDADKGLGELFFDFREMFEEIRGVQSPSGKAEVSWREAGMYPRKARFSKKQTHRRESENLRRVM